MRKSARPARGQRRPDELSQPRMSMPNQTEAALWAPESVVVNKHVQIGAPPAQVWAALTIPELMQQWMFETKLDILTEWVVGGPIIIRGKSNGARFENTGTVVQFELEKVLQYSHLSSASRLPDVPASYSSIEFRLAALAPLPAKRTELALALRTFPTEVIYKLLAYYWTVTLGIMKRRVEEH